MTDTEDKQIQELRAEYNRVRLEQIKTVAKFFNISHEAATDILDTKYWDWLCRRRYRIAEARQKLLSATTKRAIRRYFPKETVTPPSL